MECELLEHDAETLRDALAFIDAWDAEEEEEAKESSMYDVSSTGSSSSPSPVALPFSPLQQDPQASSSLRFRIVLPPARPDKEPTNEQKASAFANPARKRNSGSSRVIAASGKKGGRTLPTKEEIAALRDQVARLEAQLVLLQEQSMSKSHCSALCISESQPRDGSVLERAATGSGGTWRAGSPAVELEKVQRSLKRNRELKDALAKQLQISHALKKLVLSKRVQHGLALVSEEPSHLEAPPRLFQSYAEDPALVFAELYSNVESMYREAHPISQSIGSAGDVSSVHLSSVITHDDAISCAKLEISTSAPVAYNFRQLGRLFWSQIATPSDCIETGHYFTHAQSTATDTYEKRYNMTRSSPQGDLSFRGATVMRIFQDDAYRLVITYTSLFAETNSGAVFRESLWFILTDLNNSITTTTSNSRNFSSPPQTLFQTFYRLSTDLKPPEDVQGRAMQQFVLKSMRVAMRNKLQQMQNMVTADTEVAPLLALANNSCLSVKCLIGGGVQSADTMATSAPMRVLTNRALFTSITEFIPGVPYFVLQFRESNDPWRLLTKEIVPASQPMHTSLRQYSVRFELWQVAIICRDFWVFNALFRLQQTPTRFQPGIRWRGVMDNAASIDRLDIVRFLHEDRSEGCTQAAQEGAIMNGHLDVLQFLHENRSEGDSMNAVLFAARHGHLECVKFAHEHNFAGFTRRAMSDAMETGHLEIAKFLHENCTEGCTTNALINAERFGHHDVVDYLCHHRPIKNPGPVIKQATKQGRLRLRLTARLV